MSFGQGTHQVFDHGQHVSEHGPLVPLVLDAVLDQLSQLGRRVRTDRLHVGAHLVAAHQPQNLEADAKALKSGAHLL